MRGHRFYIKSITGCRPGVHRLSAFAAPLAAWPAAPPLRRAAEATCAALAAARGRLAPWLAVAFGAGIAGYFSLRSEPGPAWIGLALAAPLPPLLLAPRHPIAAWLLGLPAAAALGAGVAGWHARLRPPMPELPRGAAVVSGIVRQVDILPEGLRVTLDQPRLGEGAPLPRQLRIRLRSQDPARPGPGDHLTVRALVRPPAPPAYPAAWDFQRAAFFSGLGGSGFAIGPASLEPAPAAAPPLAALRRAIEARVLARLGGAEGAISVALLVGGQSAIPEPDLVAMRDSGLAHILSVSGMHIAIVMGLVFAALRLLLAAIPPLALRLPVKELAAVAALAAGGFYMVVTGSQVPMLRSFAMAALATLALLTGRRALTLRGWALAFAVVLALNPVELLGPSLQMSFAAVLALVAGWEALRPVLAAWPARRCWWGRILLALGGTVVTSLLAGAATTPFGLHHFGRLQLYGVAANAVAVPLTSFVLMPAGMLAALAMPLGLERWPLLAMGWGVDAMLAVARAVAAWPGAAVSVRPIPAWSLGIIAAGGLWLCMLQGRARWGGLALLAGGTVAGMLLHRPPDLLVSADARLIALHLDGQVFLQRGSGASGLARESWLRLWAAPAATPWPQSGTAAGGRLDCRTDVCRLATGPGAGGIVLLRGAQPAVACAGAVLVISAEPVRGRCGALVIDRFAVWRNGAHAVWLPADAGARGPSGHAAPIVVSDRAMRGDRPWVPAPPEPRRARLPRVARDAPATEPPARIEGPGPAGEAP